MFVFGRAYRGALGLGEIGTVQLFPKLLVQDENIKSVHCGGDHTIIWKKDFVWVFGWNKFVKRSKPLFSTLFKL